MARTDAKGVLERLVQRLNFCVRTVPRRRGGRGAWLMEGEQGKLDGFFGGVGAKDGARGGVKVEGGDGDGVEVEVKQEGGVKEELTPTPGILETMREGEFEARAGV